MICIWSGWRHCHPIISHSRQITTPVPHHSVFTGRMPFLPPNQQLQRTEGTINLNYYYYYYLFLVSLLSHYIWTTICINLKLVHWPLHLVQSLVTVPINVHWTNHHIARQWSNALLQPPMCTLKVSPQEVRKRSYLFSVRRHLDVGIFLGLFYFFLQASKVSEHHHARSQQQVP